MSVRRHGSGRRGDASGAMVTTRAGFDLELDTQLDTRHEPVTTLRR
jgi:hypothetical protein